MVATVEGSLVLMKSMSVIALDFHAALALWLDGLLREMDVKARTPDLIVTSPAGYHVVRNVTIEKVYANRKI